MATRSSHPYYVEAAIWALGQIGPDAGNEARRAVEVHVERSIFAKSARRAMRRLAPEDPKNVPPPDEAFHSRLICPLLNPSDGVTSCASAP